MIKLFSFLLFFSISSTAQAFVLEQFHSYESHREQFNKAVSNLAEYRVEKMNWPNLIDQNLSTEVALLKNKKFKPKKMLIISSGIHGVEAFVGSSVQLAFIKEYLQQPNEKFDFAFIHILNPWGMRNNRRVNNNNVDLNRNFLADEKAFNQKNQSYQKIDRFLNPESKVDLNFAHKFIFVLDSMYYIFKYSLESLRQAILQGQYQFPKGIYYGGTHHVDLKKHIDEFVDPIVSSYEEVIWVDLHTGYGERGRLHLLANSSDDENSKRLRSLFPDRKIDFGQNQKFYKTTGDMISFLADKSRHITGVVFEYGTMDSQKPMGSIESLRRMVLENQSYQNDPAGEHRPKAEELFLQMFNPHQEDWWKQIAPQTKDLFDLLLK